MNNKKIWIVLSLIWFVFAFQMSLQVIGADAIVILKQPDNVSGVAGETVTLSVSAMGHDLEYCWFYSDTGEYNSSAEKVEEFNNTGNEAELKILVTEYLTQGVFWCRITDADGNVMDTDTCKIALVTGSLSAAVEPTGPSPDNEWGTMVWDCVWFGSYPQSEVTGSALTDDIKNAEYNALNDATVAGKRYRRLHFGDGIYRYFLYEPIKWRVLEVKDKKALLLSDMVLDEHDYKYVSQFLNGYQNPCKLYVTGISAGIDNFKESAFSSQEQAAVVTAQIDAARETSIFSLEYSDLSISHGFRDILYKYCQKGWLRARSSDYTRVWLDHDCVITPGKPYYGSWWLNTVKSGTDVYTIQSSGEVSSTDYDSYFTHNQGIRPALWIDLEHTSVWQYAGIIESVDWDGSTGTEEINEISCEKMGGNNRQEQTIQVPSSDITISYGGEDVSIEAQAAGKLDYYSSDKTIVRVSEDGKLTAVKPGKTKVTVLASATEEYNSTVCEVMVTVERGEPKLSVAQNEIELVIGEQGKEMGQIIANTKSDAELQYEALDKTIVSTSYSGGRMLALKSGVTQVRVYQKETVYYKAAEALVNVKVYRGKSTITGLQQNYTVTYQQKGISILYQQMGSGKINVTISNPSIAYVSRSPYKVSSKSVTYGYKDYGVDIKFLKTGTVTITLNCEQSDKYEAATASFTLTITDEEMDAENSAEVGTVVTDAGSKARYKITKSDEKNRTVTYLKNTNSAKIVNIPAVILIQGEKYKVTAIAANAFKNHKKLTNVTIGKNIIKIGANAFSGCKRLTKITIKSTKLTKKSLGKNVLKGTNKKLTIKVPKSKWKKYRKYFKKKGNKSVKIKK